MPFSVCSSMVTHQLMEECEPCVPFFCKGHFWIKVQNCHQTFNICLSKVQTTREERKYIRGYNIPQKLGCQRFQYRPMGGFAKCEKCNRNVIKNIVISRSLHICSTLRCNAHVIRHTVFFKESSSILFLINWQLNIKDKASLSRSPTPCRSSLSLKPCCHVSVRYCILCTWTPLLFIEFIFINKWH